MTVRRKRTRKSTSKPVPEVVNLFDEVQSEVAEQVDMEEFSPNAMLTSMIIGAVVGSVAMLFGSMKVSGTMGVGELEMDVEKEKMGMPKYRFRKTKKFSRLPKSGDGSGG